jgi:hypothetical protein
MPKLARQRGRPATRDLAERAPLSYAKAGYEVTAVQDLMAHTDPDMTRAYQKGHARKVLRVDMMLPWSVQDDDHDGVREQPAAYLLRRSDGPREYSLEIL